MSPRVAFVFEVGLVLAGTILASSDFPLTGFGLWGIALCVAFR